jgi:hypothetical protein
MAYKTQPAAPPPPVVPGELDDATLLAAIPTAGLPQAPALAREAGRRRLHAAIPVLEDYCRRFAGLGTDRPVAEQIAALEGLHAIGGQEAAGSVARIIGRGWVRGPTLTAAVAVAAELGSALPGEVVDGLLRHADPATRADACRLARQPLVAETLIELLGDLHREVAVEAACALARLGRTEGRARLRLELRQAPPVRLVDAVAQVADEDCIVELGRIAAGNTTLAAAARRALAGIDHGLAARILRRLDA